MNTSRQRHGGFWGTFRSYLVAASVLSVLIGVLSLFPAMYAVRSFGTPGAATVSDYPLAFGAMFAIPPLCFLAPLAAYFVYRSGYLKLALMVMLVPAAMALALAGYWGVTELI